MSNNVIIFEDDLCENFNPLALTRPSFELICGMKKLWENIVGRFYANAKVGFICRDYLKDTLRQRMPADARINDLSGIEGAIFVNGRILASFSQLPPIDGNEEIALYDGSVVYARLKGSNIAKLAQLEPKAFVEKLLSLDVPKVERTVKMVKYLWELIGNNAKAIEADFSFYVKANESTGRIEDGAYVRVKEGEEIKIYGAQEAQRLSFEGKIPLFVGKGSRVYPNVTIDLTGGPVYIGAYTDVRPPSLIDGPCCIMDSSGAPKQVTIIDGALIRSGATLGPVCRVGGELEESIIQGFSNKHHAGFIGHAYIGEWVNVGAMATNSDLKNDLSTVKVPVNGQLIDTGELKVGCFIGDHVKLGIGALLTTGTVVGIMTNVLSSGDLPPQDVPSYCFYRENRLSKGFRPKMLIETAERVMSRRGVKLTQADVELLEKLYDMLVDKRDEEIEKHNRKVDMDVIRIIRQYEKEKNRA